MTLVEAIATQFLSWAWVCVAVPVAFAGAVWRLSQWGRRRAIQHIDRRLPDDVRAEIEDGRTWLERDGADPAVLLRRNGSPSPEPAPRLWTETGTGDLAFDRSFVVQGDPLHCRALLDAEARRLLTWCLRRDDRVQEGTVRVALGALDPASIEARVGELRQLAGAVAPMDARFRAARLAHIARTDPVARVRALAFDAWCSTAPDADANALFRDVAQDPEPLVAVRAAARLGDRSALAAFRAHASGEVREQALLGTVPFSDAVAILAAHQEDPDVVVACLEATGNPAAEDPLLGFLRAPGRVGERAAQALGAVGTARAIPELRARGGRDCEEAIARIQARIGPEGAGGVSLVESAGGAVSIAGGGEVSEARGSRARD